MPDKTQVRLWSLDWNRGKKVWVGIQGAKLEEKILSKGSLEQNTKLKDGSKENRCYRREDLGETK